MRVLIFIFAFIFCVVDNTVLAQIMKKMTKEDYIEAYKNLAIKEMHRSGVPSSITLSQGILESDNGNSRLAVKGNNHFGIKCHKDWDGQKIYHNDEQKAECFRKYDSVSESYADHSDFLRNALRYSFLFDYNSDDYRSWAKGLQSAGYATNPKYADLLIKIIEDNELHKYDLGTENVSSNSKQKDRKTYDSGSITRKILVRNRIDYIIVQENDTYEKLQKELGLLPFELYKYNDLNSDSLLYPGMELYLQPKRNKAEPGKQYHIVKKGETMYSISQLYGVKLESLYSWNNNLIKMDPEEGQKIYLRKNVRGEKDRIKSIPEDKEEEIKFDFQ